MSMNKIFLTTAIAALGVSSLATAAEAQNSRYGGNDVYAYESGQNCQVNPCAPVQQAPVQSSRYGGEYIEQAPAYQPAPVYVDCAQMGTCGPQVLSQPTTVYTQPMAPAPMPMYQAQTQYAQAPVNCPAGTTAQPDGTCLQGSSYGSTTSTYGSSTSSYGSTYGSTSTYGNTEVEIYSDPAPVAPAMPVNCPAGTTAQPDGTCLQGSGYSSGSTYSSSSSVTLPGTYGSSSESSTVYSGDASVTPSYGYTSDGAYTAQDYMPIRK